MAQGYFITGTDTDVGKTTIALGLMAAFQKQGLTVAAMKPVSAGCEPSADGLRNEDALRLMGQASIDLHYELVNPYAFEPAIAPHIAASESGITMQTEPLVKAYKRIAKQADVVVVEGAGGWLVPLNDSQTMADLAIALGLPVINVVGIRLGCLNHAQLTAESIHAHDLKQVGWVANHLSADMLKSSDNIQSLTQRLPDSLLGEIPYLNNPDAEGIANYLDVTSLRR